MYGNIDKVIIDINKIVSDLKELLDKLIIKLSSNSLNDEPLEGLVELYSNDKDFYNAINILMDYLSFDKCINLMEFSNS